MDWQEFVGRTVEKVEINDDKDLLVFTFSDGDGGRIFASATGDCCSTSWFEHVEGLECLIGHKIMSVSERAMPDSEDNGDCEVIKFYGWTIATPRGRFDIEMRNRSNGYYGGSVELSVARALNAYGNKRESGELKELCLPKTDWVTPEITEHEFEIKPRRIVVQELDA